MSDHAAMNPLERQQIREEADRQHAALSRVETELQAALLDRDHWYQHPESDCEYHKRMVAAESERDALRDELAAMKACWGADGVRAVTEQRAINAQVVRRAEAAESRISALEEALRKIEQWQIGKGGTGYDSWPGQIARAALSAADPVPRFVGGAGYPLGTPADPEGETA